MAFWPQGLKIPQLALSGPMTERRSSLCCAPMRRCLALSVLLLSSTSAIAADEEVLVTARLLPPVGNAAFSTVVLDPRDLLTAPQLDSALAQVPGLSLFRRNSSVSANPTTQGVSLRSIAPSGAGRALVTLDGVPQNDPFGFWVIWSALPGEAIQSADIVRGAGAGPYGAGALTGVIALTERAGPGMVLDVSGGERGTGRIGGAIGLGQFVLSGSAQTSDGWIPVNAAQRGAADNHVTLEAYNGALRGQVALGAGTTAVARLAAYSEKRDSGLVGASSTADGWSGSLTVAHPPQGSDMGWRLQGWVRSSDFSNVAVAVAAARVSTTLSNDQYATPAIGWGMNAALRDSTPLLNWEIGVDSRMSDGESKEYFQFVSGAFTSSRVAGGKNLVGGAYAEGAMERGALLLTAGARLDYWQNSDGHLLQRTRSTGVVTLQQDYAAKDGVVPTARGGLRYSLGNGVSLRSAAYAGFRVPSLNELYRPFRLGNNVTQANAALKPERLYGAELGAGDDEGALTWQATAFVNRLDDAITNVTIGQGPGNFPGVGFVPAGGLLIQRRNAGAIDAIGLEADAHYNIGANITLDGGLAIAEAKVDGGTSVPQLDGKRPVQAPSWTVTAGLTMMPVQNLTVSSQVRFESERFADDLNSLRLGRAARVNATVSWAFTPALSAYVAADNIFDEAIATTKGADGVVSYDAPRLFRVGLTFTN